ncbi:hypothetical protein AGRA3207_003539 [Actinomadura graeca]|uniref:Uncharacterized protein n=1 Tax=Actinomadura graeca TaxID=2750812 RepID=A0ABX8R0H1_9ACTN|nr:hypothetical protein [Actinomadura graeca]QXJ22523.1 hypothetical protein AGRA3207_003539 [Actinomadura graeca]
MGWSKKDHENEATRLLAKADQYKAAGDKGAHDTLMIQVEGHKRLAREGGK